MQILLCSLSRSLITSCRVLWLSGCVEQSLFLLFEDPRPAPHSGVNHVLQRAPLLHVNRTQLPLPQIADVLAPEEVLSGGGGVGGRKVLRNHARNEGDVRVPESELVQYATPA